MGIYLGLSTYDYSNDVQPDDLLTFLSTLPAGPVVTEKEWEHICNYFDKNAPDTLPLIERSNTKELTQFEVSKFKLPGQYGNPLVTMLEVDTVSENIFVGTRQSRLFKLDKNFVPKDSFPLSSPPSYINFQNVSELYFSLMGNMDPNDQAEGKIISLPNDTRLPTTLIDSLKRPVHFEKIDLNSDGREDFVVCSFGNFTGALLVYENTENGYVKRVINAQPGTRKVVVKDFNDDGLPDILAMTAQADEKIILFTNKGDFEFKFKLLLRFPPVYGSSYFDVADFNHDGLYDILYTNGDNADLTMILKPYHGVRIFMNTGHDNFTETWFHPMYGASEALARDFDGDGDLDIAAISFFPDFKNHYEDGFIFFENVENHLIPHTTELAKSGRWLKLEAADFDKDGDEDILLGALDFRPMVPDSVYQHWMQEKTAILILRNKLK
ncbi:MAG: VCBS repeat-containing protein [Bacteroidia bacterium]|nr:VCBS repeat-containing protein [Bacteroidia bacterium]